MSNRPSFKGVLVLAMVAVVAGVVMLSGPGGQSQAPPPELLGILRPEPQPLEPFVLTDQEGRPFGLERLQGHTSLVFFGFSHCPEVCPTTLTTLAAMVRELGDSPEAEDLQVILVSVDPERDTPEVLAEYIRNFNPDFIALTGEKREIDNLGRQLGAGYVREDGEGEEYVFSHTSSIFMIDREGRLIAAFPPPHKASALAAQFRRIQGLRR